jgi:hypothetical protein
LHVALGHYFNCGTKLRDTLKIMGQIRLAVPIMSKIWAGSQLAHEGMHKKIEQVIVLEDMAREGIKEGKYTLDDPITLKIE